MTTTAATEAPAKKADGAVKVVGILVLIAGIVMIVAGAFTWASVSSHLKAENITVSEDAANYAGKQVAGPLTAYAEAEVIQKHALEATGGKTYAELDREDPVREVAMTTPLRAKTSWARKRAAAEKQTKGRAALGYWSSRQPRPAAVTA